MANGMRDYSFSMKMRDVVRKLVKEEIQSQRPRYRYGKVTAVNHTTQVASVIFNAEITSVPVPYGHFNFVKVNDQVRVDGIGTDKFISDIVGWDRSIRATDPTDIPLVAATKGYIDNTAGSNAVSNNTLVRRGAAGNISAADPTAAVHVVTKGFLDAAKFAIDIPSGADLDNYIAPGTYAQKLNASAAAGTNYPVPYAGLLEVNTSSSSSFVYQRYTVYKTYQAVWIRNLQAGGWGAWSRMDYPEIPRVSTGVGTALTGWSITTQSGYARSGIAFGYFNVSRTGAAITVPASGDITNSDIVQLSSTWMPVPAGIYGLGHALSGGVAAAAIDSVGVVTLAAVSSGMTIATGASLSVAGSWPI